MDGARFLPSFCTRAASTLERREMRRSFFIPVLVLGLAAASFPLQAHAQQQQQPSSDPYAPPPAPAQPPSMQPQKNCSGQAQWGSKAPTKTSSTCPPATQNSDTTPPLNAPAANSQQPKKSTAEDNPFPEDVSKKAEDAARARDVDDAKPSPTADPGANESSSRENLDKLDLLGDKDGRLSNGAGGVVYNPKLATDDIHVGQFYFNREDYKGAYVRFKEATQADPGNPDAVFYLAEAARKMNQNQEALQNYQLYLDAVPGGSKAKDARKAVHDLSASAKH
jgi:tetratricopeptide (TPR) repeat protein